MARLHLRALDPARRPLAWLALLSVVLCGPAVAQETASELFAEGNRLYRDDLYWAALLRYEQAADAGMDTPLLHFNVGVAHYRARQYDRAREAFERAALDARLAVLARYNLGLVARVAGDRDDALRHFRDVREQQAKPELAALADRAINSMLEQSPVLADIDTAPRRMLDALKGLDLRVTLGVGNDSNPYRAPEMPYNDRSQPGAPLVTPLEQPGVYYPFDLQARYSVQSFEHESFFGSYRVAGRYYPDPPLDNANELSQQLAFGTEYRRRTDERERRIYSAFTIARHTETWFDPDDGSERMLAGENVGDRLSYTRYGPELWARQSFSRLSFNLHAKGQIWNYDNAEGLPEFDHELLSGGLSAQYRFTSTSLFRISADIYQRRFGDRRSYDTDGVERIGNPDLRYDYTNLGATARQRITRFFWFGLKYARTERSDQHVGYNDFYRDGYGAEFSVKIGDRFSLRADAWYRIYNYTRAFAYHDPAAGRKTLETAEVLVDGRWQLTPAFALVARADLRETASNDLRIDYARNQIMLGVEWRSR